MKKIIYIAGLLLVLASCEKEETRAVLSENPVPPSITKPSSGTAIVLSTATPSPEIMFNWTKADFGFKAMVVYSVQMDTLNANYKRSSGTANFATTSVGSDTALVKHKDMIAKLKVFKLPANVENTVEIRIRAILEKTDTIYSNPMTLKVTYN
jgi:hypothetical protein